uniref:Uncharacterized protein n=1 Tax=Populus trichocarpa TaxID=3694 RepID=A0A3N7FP51_POPTR
MDSEIIFSSACHGWPCNVSTFLDTSLKGFSMPLDCLVLAFGYTCYLQEIPILKSSARIAAQLNYLCPQFFPTPACLSLHYHNNEMQPSPASRSCFKAFSKQFAENLLKFNLRPHAHLGLDKSNVPSLIAPSDVINELLLDIPEIVDAA